MAIIFKSETGMRRRRFIKYLGGAQATWPNGTRAQQVGTARIGILNVDNPEPFPRRCLHAPSQDRIGP